MPATPRNPKLLLATRNPGKARELASLLNGCPFPLATLAEAGVDEDVPETGASLEENAKLKAEAYFRLSGLPTLADDSGLEVDALGGEPGPLSSRYAGESATDDERIAYLLNKLDNIPEENRQARFRCVIAVAWPGRPVELHAGELRGRIVGRATGEFGFGYDPVFYLPELGMTMAEVAPDEKNRISHRGIAARKAVTALRRIAEELTQAAKGPD